MTSDITLLCSNRLHGCLYDSTAVLSLVFAVFVVYAHNQNESSNIKDYLVSLSEEVLLNPHHIPASSISNQHC